jgi:PIN domain nuclease of toxin-antitoxin system
MKLLLDTSAFLWFVGDLPKLSQSARRHIFDFNNHLYLSIASAWELGIKVGIGKFQLVQPIKTFITTQTQRNNIELLPIALDEIELVSALPLHHKDPFDRLLAAQSLVYAMPIISSDTKLDLYGVQRLW